MEYKKLFTIALVALLIPLTAFSTLADDNFSDMTVFRGCNATSNDNTTGVFVGNTSCTTTSNPVNTTTFDEGSVYVSSTGFGYFNTTIPLTNVHEGFTLVSSFQITTGENFQPLYSTYDGARAYSEEGFEIYLDATRYAIAYFNDNVQEETPLAQPNYNPYSGESNSQFTLSPYIGNGQEVITMVVRVEPQDHNDNVTIRWDFYDINGQLLHNRTNDEFILPNETDRGYLYIGGSPNSAMSSEAIIFQTAFSNDVKTDEYLVTQVSESLNVDVEKPTLDFSIVNNTFEKFREPYTLTVHPDVVDNGANTITEATLLIVNNADNSDVLYNETITTEVNNNETITLQDVESHKRYAVTFYAENDAGLNETFTTTFRGIGSDEPFKGIGATALFGILALIIFLITALVISRVYNTPYKDVMKILMTGLGITILGVVIITVFGAIL